MTGFETASLVIAGANATASITAATGIWYGIRAMVRANRERAVILDQQREADERRHAEAMRAGDQRHAEAMAALNELIQAGQRQHEATMRVLERQGAALERQGAALETMIERTAPKPALGAPAE